MNVNVHACVGSSGSVSLSVLETGRVSEVTHQAVGESGTGARCHCRSVQTHIHRRKYLSDSSGGEWSLIC